MSTTMWCETGGMALLITGLLTKTEYVTKVAERESYQRQQKAGTLEQRVFNIRVGVLRMCPMRLSAPLKQR